MLARSAHVANFPATSGEDNGSTFVSALSSTAGSSERRAQLCALVRRYLVLSQVSPAEWSRHETSLMLLSESLLNRYTIFMPLSYVPIVHIL